MQFTLQAIQPSKQAKNCQIIGVFTKGAFATASTKMIDSITNNYITRLIMGGLFSAQLEQTFPLFYMGSLLGLEHLLLVGCGQNSPLTIQDFRKIIIATTRALNQFNLTEAMCYLSELPVLSHQQLMTLPWKISYLAQTIEEANYQFTQFKTEKPPTNSLATLTIHLPDMLQQTACLESLSQGVALAKGIRYTKDLSNLPSNLCTPTFLADKAKELSKQYHSLKVTVIEEKAMQRLGMGALLAVSRGSNEPAKLICLEYNGATAKKAPIVLVGKGITFDTGGISLKSSDSIVGMKYDMCGAATVLSTLLVAAELTLPLNVVGVVAAVENMPDGKAYKPEDILTSLSGQTIEVISTDAEGRLILCDALTYCERYQPAVVIDIATLTGAVVIALGNQVTGLLSNHQPLADALLTAGKTSGDYAWQLPLFEEYQEQIKSPFADMANTGGRAAGTITAACFLSRFAKKFHWAHLDVAGTAAIMSGTNERLATGRPVPLLVRYLINQVLSETEPHS